MSLLTPLRSLRARMAAAIALVGALVSLGIAVTVYQLDESNTIARDRSDLATRVTLLAAIAAHSRAPVPGATRDDRFAPAALKSAVARHGLLGTDLHGSVLWAGTPLGRGGGIYVRTSLSPDLGALRTLRDELVVVGALATLGSALLGAFIAATLSRRLVHAAATADAIGDGDLAARVRAGGEDEITRLGDAIDGMAAALSERIARERRFSAEVAHELRTPLTALVTAGALLSDERPADIVRERVATLRELVEDLLEIARLDAGTEAVQAADVDLPALVRTVAEAIDPPPGIEVRNPRTVVSDPRRIQRVVSNLLDNAHRHGADPVTVSVCGSRIEVRDHGDGYSPQLLRDGPRPFAAGEAARGTGTGLGLVIAQAQAQAIGATLTFANADAADGGGALATLELPAGRPGRPSVIAHARPR